MSIIATNNQYYQDIASAIRTKLGVSTQYYPSEMASAIDTFPANANAESFVYKTLEYINNSTASFISDYVFYGYSKLSTAIFTACTKVST